MEVIMEDTTTIMLKTGKWFLNCFLKNRDLLKFLIAANSVRHKNVFLLLGIHEPQIISPLNLPQCSQRHL